MLIRTPCLLTMRDEPIYPGYVRIEGERIASLGQHTEPFPGEDVIDLHGQLLMPGFINAHCHLDYTGFRKAIFPGKTFAEWVSSINRLKSTLTPEDYLNDIAKGFRMLIDSGCTTVFNIEAFPDLLLQMPPPPIRTWWFLEFIDLRQRISSDTVLAGVLQFFDGHPEWLGGFGLSPHAPYTASVELYRLAKRCAVELNMPWTTHISESLDEHEMFLHADGPLYEFLDSLGRDMSDCGQGSAFSHLVEYGLIQSSCLAVHMNYLQEYDFEFLSEMPLSIVHCPKCHEFFGHTRFPLERLREIGCNLSLGTDSLASNDTLDMRSEIRQARHHYPNIHPREWLAMCTTHPARTIGAEDHLGSLRPGALADLVAFPLPENTDPYEAVIRSTCKPGMVMVNGHRLDSPGQQP